MATKKTTGRPDNRRPTKSARSRPSKAAQKKPTRKRTPRQLMLADLKRSGLTDGDAKKAGYKPLTAEEVKKLTGNYATGYLIPYPDIKGIETKYWRVRYTSEVKGPFGAAKKKPPRYTSGKDLLPRFYFPRHVDWKALASDTDEPLVITEGEKKAEAACKAGIPCFSVPGVWSWRSKKKGIPAIPDFNVIKWKGRKVSLCFDNDVMTNPQVITALNALSNELTNRGAKVSIKFLPKGRGKIGLDDYLVRFGVKAWLNLKQEEYSKGAALYQLNERLAFVNKLGCVYDFDAERFYKSRADLLFNFADRWYLQPKANPEDGFKKVNAAQAWLEWPEKRRYKDICYAPGEDEVVDGKINFWKGWGCEPKQA